MRVQAKHLGKKFARDWIFREVNLEWENGKKYAITGGNGSGKTTLLKTLAGTLPPTEGEVSYQLNGNPIDPDTIWNYLTMSGPYTEVIEEFTLDELLDFYVKFKPLSKTKNEIVDLLGFKRSRHKLIRDFSSGMKQKLKLALSFFSEGHIVLLDEPTSNLDSKNIEWYLGLAREPMPDKILVICSNQPYEYDFCDEVLAVERYKGIT